MGFDITSLLLLAYDHRWARVIKVWLCFNPLGLLVVGWAHLTARPHSMTTERRNALSMLADEVRQRQRVALK